MVLNASASSPSSSARLTSTCVSKAPPVTARAASRSCRTGAVTVRTELNPSKTAASNPRPSHR